MLRRFRGQAVQQSGVFPQDNALQKRATAASFHQAISQADGFSP
jgi:hypothetical protein